MNLQEQVARLEALLTRVQHNGAVLRKERGLGGVSVEVHEKPADTPRATATMHGTPTKLLPTSMDDARALTAAADAARPGPSKTPPPKPSSIPAAAPTLIPASNEAVEVGLGASSGDHVFGRQESHEETKPLWVGLSEPPPHPAASASSTPSTSTQAHEVTDADLRDSSPPLSGERPSTRSPSLLPQEAPMSLEEPLVSARGIELPAGASTFTSPSEPAVAISTASLDSHQFTEDRESRISDAPASALGGTINLPEADVGDVELELAEPPPSSLRSVAPATSTPTSGDDELEADLPRTSYRAAYDDSLSAPPKAREELLAHDQNVRDRVSSAPAPAVHLSSPPASEVTHPAAHAGSLDSEIPPVLSSHPQSPVTIPPQSAVEPLRALGDRGDRGEAVSFDRPIENNYPSIPQTSDVSLVDEARSSIPPYQTTVSDVVLSARPTPQTVEFTPRANAVAASFEGEVPRAKDASFLELLDTSLGLTVRG